MRVDLNAAWRQIQAIVNGLITLLPNLLLGFVMFGFFYLTGQYAAKLVRLVSERAGQSHGVGLLLGRLAHYVIAIIGLLVAFSVVFPSFDARALIQTLGIGGVAIGFAFKDIFQNFFAGILILLSRPFRIGDQIIVKGYEGTVEDIQTRATMIRTYDSQRVVIPNTVLFAEAVTVITAYESRRTDYEIGIGYGDDIENARKVILEAIASLDEVEQEPKADVLAMGFDESSVTLRVRWWTSPKRVNILVARDRVITSIKNALGNAGIDIPYPTRTVLFHDQTESTDGDRARQREGWPAREGESPEPRWRLLAQAGEERERTAGASRS